MGINSSDDDSTPNRPHDFGLSRLEEIGEAAQRQTAEEREFRRRAKAAGREREIIESLDPATRGTPMFSKMHRAAILEQQRLQPRIRVIGESRGMRYIDYAAGVITRNLSPAGVNKVAGEYAEAADVQTAALGMTGQSYGQLQEQRGTIMAEIDRLRSRGEEMIRTPGMLTSQRGLSPKGIQQYAALAQQADIQARQLAQVNVAMGHLERAGQDPTSVMRGLMGSVEGARATVAGSEIAQDPILGRMSVRDLKKQEVEQSKTLVDSFNQLQEAIRGGAKNVDALSTNFKNAADELGKTKEAIRQGGGGFLGGGRLASITAGAGVAATIFSAAANTAQQVLLTQPNQITQNRITAAQMSNQMYDMRRAALAGDMTALTTLGSDVFDVAQTEGNKNYRSMQGVNALRLGAGVATGLGIAGGIISMTGVGAAVGVPMMIAGAALGGGAAAMDLGRGASATQEMLAERQRQIQLRQQFAHVTGAQRQLAYNFATGSANVALSLGGGSQGQAWLRETTGAGAEATMAQMGQMGIGPDQFSQLSAFGAANMGSTFRTGQVFAARGLERAGFGTMQENLQRQALLASAGSNNPEASYGKVLEMAFSKSLEGAKVLNMVAENTAATARASGGFGLGMDVTTGAAQALTAAYGKDNVNKEAGLERAMSAAEAVDKMTTRTTTDYVGSINVARMQTAAKISFPQALVAAQMDEAQFRTMFSRFRAAKTPEERRAVAADFRAAGLSEIVQTDQNGNQSIAESKIEAIARSRTIQKISMGDAGLGLLTGRQDYMSLVKEIQAGGKFSELIKQDRFGGLRDMYATARALTPEMRGAGMDEIIRLADYDNVNMDPKMADKVEKDMKGKTPLTPEMQQAEDRRTAQAKDQVQQMRLASEQMGSFAGLLSKVNEAQQDLLKKGAESGTKFADAAGKAAVEFSQSTKTFTGQLNQLGEVLVKATQNIRTGKWTDLESKR